MAKKFKKLTKDFSPERRERIEARKAKLREEMNLAELRQALSLTQKGAALLKRRRATEKQWVSGVVAGRN